MIEPLYVAAREVLLDALDALGEQREALILAGAQAIYIHTGAADLAVAEFTTDGDLVVNPEQLKTQPRLSEAMERAHFRSGLQPGSWLRDRTVSGIATTIPVDLLVPEAVAGAGQRARGLGDGSCSAPWVSTYSPGRARTSRTFPVKSRKLRFSARRRSRVLRLKNGEITSPGSEE